jgi:two-component system OmpR family response regulator
LVLAIGRAEIHLVFAQNVRARGPVMAWDLSDAVRPLDLAPAETGTAAPFAPKGPKVLIVESDEVWKKTLALYLTQCGLGVEVARDGRAMDQALTVSAFDLVVIEVMLPGEDGLSICRRLSPTSPSIILMSAEASEVDRIVGLELGADDYLSKPCSPRELLARARAILRGRDHSRAVTLDNATYRFGGYELDVDYVRLRTPAGETALLTHSESILLIAFLERPRRVLSREFLLNYAHKDGAVRSERAIDVQINRLRRKLGNTNSDEIMSYASRSFFRIEPPDGLD